MSETIQVVCPHCDETNTIAENRETVLCHHCTERFDPDNASQKFDQP